MGLSLLLVMMFLAASLGVAAGYSIWKDLRQRDSFRARRRVESEFQKPEIKPPPRANLFKSVNEFDLNEIAPDRLSAFDAPLPEPERTDLRPHYLDRLAACGVELPLSLFERRILTSAST